jgi:hypothetical protein
MWLKIVSRESERKGGGESEREKRQIKVKEWDQSLVGKAGGRSK